MAIEARRPKRPKREAVTKNTALFLSASAYCRSKGYPLPTGGDEELVFAKDHGRKYAFDCAWPEAKAAIEFQGGGQRGRHARFGGYNNDCLKLAYAVGMGWRLFYVTTHQATKGMHFLLMDFLFGHQKIELLAAGLNDLSAFYRAKPKARLQSGLPSKRRVERAKAGKKS